MRARASFISLARSLANWARWHATQLAGPIKWRALSSSSWSCDGALPREHHREATGLLLLAGGRRENTHENKLVLSSWRWLAGGRRREAAAN